MPNVYCIFTHHEKTPDSAVRAWKRLGICAIGWAALKNIKDTPLEQLQQEFKKNYPTDKKFNNIKLFRQIEKGDLVLAYTGGNTIAYTGKVVGEYIDNRKNEVGSEQGFGYPHQYPVKWEQEPRYFNRKDLGDYFTKQFGKRGMTVAKIDLGHKDFNGFKKMLLECANSDSQQTNLNEDMVKAGLQKYLNDKLNELETGLILESAEDPINKENRPDFIAKDANGKKVIIECKGWAHANAAEQIIRYRNQYKTEKPRCVLIAFKIDSDCKRAAKEAGIEIIECDLKFKKFKTDTEKIARL